MKIPETFYLKKQNYDKLNEILLITNEKIGFALNRILKKSLSKELQIFNSLSNLEREKYISNILNIEALFYANNEPFIKKSIRIEKELKIQLRDFSKNKLHTNSSFMCNYFIDQFEVKNEKK